MIKSRRSRIDRKVWKLRQPASSREGPVTSRKASSTAFSSPSRACSRTKTYWSTAPSTSLLHSFQPHTLHYCSFGGESKRGHELSCPYGAEEAKSRAPELIPDMAGPAGINSARQRHAEFGAEKKDAALKGRHYESLCGFPFRLRYTTAHFGGTQRTGLKTGHYTWERRMPTREDAWKLLCKYTASESFRKHMLAVEACVRAYARKAGADEETSSLAALLHDFDYERWPNQEHAADQGHPSEGAKILRERGYPEEVIRAILSHADYCNF